MGILVYYYQMKEKIKVPYGYWDIVCLFIQSLGHSD